MKKLHKTAKKTKRVKDGDAWRNKEACQRSPTVKRIHLLI